MVIGKVNVIVCTRGIVCYGVYRAYRKYRWYSINRSDRCYAVWANQQDRQILRDGKGGDDKSLLSIKLSQRMQ